MFKDYLRVRVLLINVLMSLMILFGIPQMTRRAVGDSNLGPRLDFAIICSFIFTLRWVGDPSGTETDPFLVEDLGAEVLQLNKAYTKDQEAKQDKKLGPPLERLE